MADGSYFRFDDCNKIKYTYSFQIIINSYYVSTQVANSVCAHERVILVFISRVAQITLLSASTVRRVSTYIILFLTRYNESIIDDNSDDLYIDPISHSLFSHSADDVTMDWWWRHLTKQFCPGGHSKIFVIARLGSVSIMRFIGDFISTAVSIIVLTYFILTLKSYRIYTVCSLIPVLPFIFPFFSI